jgi:hypothetical protein
MAVEIEDALAAYEKLPVNEQVQIDQLAALLVSSMKMRRGSLGHTVIFGRNQAMQVLFALGLFLARRSND